MGKQMPVPDYRTSVKHGAPQPKKSPFVKAQNPEGVASPGPTRVDESAGAKGVPGKTRW